MGLKYDNIERNGVQVLDCTLRDGGYCNDWTFGKFDIIKIVRALFDSRVDIIECGYLSQKRKGNIDKTIYNDIRHLESILSGVSKDGMFVAMINYGEYEINDLPECQETSVDGIRLAFHKKDWSEALYACRKIKEKGYKVFVQPMVTISYTEEECINLINRVNEICPYVFYIVDSFGTMKKKELRNYMQLLETYLKDSIIVGFHAHNNLQSAYSNAQMLVEEIQKRMIIIDVSICGMGRGAGNLNAELFLDYINEQYGQRYDIKPLIRIIDKVILKFYKNNPWGYSLPNYLSAKHRIHPNYAKYLCDKHSLTVDMMDEIFSKITPERAIEFEPDYIEELYIKHMSVNAQQMHNFNEFKRRIYDKKILLIAPGKTARVNKKAILEFIEINTPIVISINYDYPYAVPDYIFVSNIRRFEQLPPAAYKNTIVTSNIREDSVYMKVNYFDLLNTYNEVRDNAGMMAIKLFMEAEVHRIYLAGFDGYDVEAIRNYEDSNLELYMTQSHIQHLNNGIGKAIREFSKNIDIEFITPSQFAEPYMKNRGEK